MKVIHIETLPSLVLFLANEHIRTAPPCAGGYHPRCVQSSAVAAFCAEQHNLRRIKMKTSLIMGALSLVLLIAGCNTNSAPLPPVAGPAGPQGQVGQTGQTGASGQQGDTGQQGMTGDTGQTGDRGRMGHTGDTGQTGNTGDTGRTGYTGDTGQTGRTGEQGEQGKEAPCPAGQHRYTSPDSGRVSCVNN